MTSEQQKPSDSSDKIIKYYFIPPMPSYYEYQDINQDSQLRTDVVNYFYHKLLKWITSSSLYEKYQKHEDYLYKNKTEVKQKIYKLLRYFVKKANINWYELRTNQLIIKEFFSKKFNLLI
jgi:hypothetical protein